MGSRDRSAHLTADTSDSEFQIVLIYTDSDSHRQTLFGEWGANYGGNYGAAGEGFHIAMQS